MSVSSFNTAQDSQLAYNNMVNTPYNAAADSQAAYAAMPNAGLSGSTGSAGPLISNNTGAGQIPGEYIPSTINQTERLFTTRSRSINFLGGDGNRGQRTYIKLLTSNASTSIQSHLSSANYSPTSLGTATSGPLSDAINGNKTTLGFASFLLTDIGGSFDEKLQVTEVFGDAEVTYYFGRQPMSIEFGGLLIDSPDNNWFLQWMEMYANALRGSQLAKNYELVQIVTPNLTMTGTVTRMSWNQNAARDVDIPFRFTLLAKTITPNPVIPTGAPLYSGSTNLLQTVNFATQSMVNAVKLTTTLVNTIQNPSSTIAQIASALRGVGILGAAPNNMSVGIQGASGLSNTAATSSILGGVSSIGSMLGASSSAISAINKVGNTISQLNGAGLMGFVNGTNSATTNTGGNVDTTTTNGNIFATVSANLAGIRASLYSPVVGVVSSLTKLISSTTGSATSVTNTFSAPLQNLVAGATSVSSQATGIINMVNGSTSSIPGVSDPSLISTIGSLQKTAGCIASAPQSITSSLSGLTNIGNLNPSTGLNFANMQTSSVSALLNSGSSYTALSGASI